MRAARRFSLDSPFVGCVLSAPMRAWLILIALCGLLASAGADDSDSRAGAVLLRNGHVLSGAVRVEGEHTVVESAGGATIRLRAGDIAFVGASLGEVYEHQRGKRDLSRAADSVSLAQWCVRNELLDEAEAELAEAQRIEPNHPLLRRVAGQIEAARASRARNNRPPAASPGQRTSFDDMDRFVRGLRGDAIEQFSSQIQPLLLNHCAAAGCHAPRATQGFRLAAGGSSRPSRRLTLRNLQAVLEQVDRDRPAESPILKHALAAHGQLHAPVFSDADSFAYQRLAHWIAQLGKQPVVPEHSPGPMTARDQLLGQAIQTSPGAGGVVPASATAPRVSPPAAAPVTVFPEGDPFDPAEFNGGTTP